MHYYLAVFKNYATFTGRARRSEYWYFILFHVLIVVALGLFAAILDENKGTPIFVMLIGLYMLAAIIPSLAVVVRRLHDIGKSGWYYFVSLIPLIGSIWLLVLLCTEGDRGDNQYGPDPKAEEMY